MNSSISNYREIDPIEAVIVAADFADAWKDPLIPKLQYDVARAELDAYRAGKSVAPFDALIRCMHQLNAGPYSLLDVGASSGYYNEVLKIAGCNVEYTAVDFGPTFKTLAEKIYPGIRFDIGDARNLPYKNDSHDIVLSGCCLLHIFDQDKVVHETARVARKYAIFSKTPVIFEPTKYFEKTAYGVPMLEIHTNEAVLLGLFRDAGLKLIYATDVYPDADSVRYRTYLLEKEAIAHYPV